MVHTAHKDKTQVRHAFYLEHECGLIGPMNDNSNLPSGWPHQLLQEATGV